MIGYTTIGANDLVKALAFYDAFLSELGGKRMMELPAMKEWVAAAKKEPDEIDELDAEF